MHGGLAGIAPLQPACFRVVLQQIIAGHRQRRPIRRQREGIRAMGREGGDDGAVADEEDGAGVVIGEQRATAPVAGDGHLADFAGAAQQQLPARLAALRVIGVGMHPGGHQHGIDIQRGDQRGMQARLVPGIHPAQRRAGAIFFH